MGADKNMVFTFNRVDPSTSSVGFVSADQEGNVVINFIAGDYGNTVHELKHAAQAQQGLITLSPGSDVVTFTGILPINAEIQGNQRQYSATQRVPVSDGGRPASFRGVKDSNVRGIYYIDSSGRKVYPYNSPIYQRQ